MKHYPIREPLNRIMCVETPAHATKFTRLIRIEIRVTPMCEMEPEGTISPDLNQAVWADAYVSTFEASEGRYIAHFLRTMMRLVLSKWLNTESL